MAADDLDNPDDRDGERALIESLYAGLSTEPYHVFLGVPEDATGDALREAFHERARKYHPDRWYSFEDPKLGAKVYAVYKRITEAYRVLSNPEMRRRYREGGRPRLEVADRAPAVRRPEDAVAHPTAKKYYLLALDAERRRDDKTAKLNLSLALQLEPDNPVLKEKLEKYR